MKLQFTGMPTPVARNFQRGENDAWGNPPERFASHGDALECRHCGEFIAEGDDVLLLAWSPFSTRQPFAESGPVLLHARECEGYDTLHSTPHAIATAQTRLVRGYTADERIVYGTGHHAGGDEIETACKRLFEDPQISFVHIRSSTNNCWQGRVDRTSA